MYNKYFKGVHTLLDQTKRLEQVIKDPLFQAESNTTFTEGTPTLTVPVDLTVESPYSSSLRAFVDYSGFGTSTFDETGAEYLDSFQPAQTGDNAGCNLGVFSEDEYTCFYRISANDKLDVQATAFVPLKDASGTTITDFEVTTGMSISGMFFPQDNPISDIGGDYTDFALYPLNYLTITDMRFISTEHVLYSYETTDNSLKQTVAVGLNTYIRIPTADSNIFLWLRTG